MSEFTGERVIPGQVNDDLWAEHISRYAFAERFAPGRRILDVGCGTGYGAAELARNTLSTVTGLDNARDAVSYASTHFPVCRFVQGSAISLPFAARSFDLVTAFELIEHLADWPLLLREARRVLVPGGLLLVSTPNRLYYAESRGEHGPNPFHQHEFEFQEFRNALTEHFPQVRLYLQNRMEAIAFHAPDRYTTAEAAIASSTSDPAQANFFIALCSTEPIPEAPALLYVPKATNLLREREHHIRLLEAELKQKQEWLEGITSDRDRLLQLHAELQKQFDERGQWAHKLNQHWTAAQARIVELQAEVETAQNDYQRHLAALQQENDNKTQWALDTEEELRKHTEELAKTVRLLDTAESTVVERTEWARRLERQLEAHRTRLAMLQGSRWIKLGRAVGLGPKVDGEPE